MSRGAKTPCPTCGHKYIPPNLGASLRAHYEAGATITDLAESTQLTAYSVRRALTAAGAEFRRPGHRRRPAEEAGPELSEATQ